MRKCEKCGQPILKKHSGMTYLAGYKTNDNLCQGCNATNSIVKRYENGSRISLEELKVLPNYLVFNPRDDNPVEENYGLRFVKLIEEYGTNAQTTG